MSIDPHALALQGLQVPFSALALAVQGLAQVIQAAQRVRALRIGASSRAATQGGGERYTQAVRLSRQAAALPVTRRHVGGTSPRLAAFQADRSPLGIASAERSEQATAQRLQSMTGNPRSVPAQSASQPPIAAVRRAATAPPRATTATPTP